MRDDIDLLIEKAMKKKNEGIICPPSQDVWAEVAMRLERQREKEFLESLKPVLITSASAIILIVVMILFVVQ